MVPQGLIVYYWCSIVTFPIDFVWRKSPIRLGFTQFDISNIPHKHKAKIMHTYIVVLIIFEFMYLRITLSVLKLSINDFHLILFLLAIVLRNSCNIALKLHYFFSFLKWNIWVKRGPKLVLVLSSVEYSL